MAIGATVLALVVPAAALPGDWPQFQFAADRTGYNPDETTLSPSNVSQLGLGWRTSISNAPLSGPVVASGVVYVGSNDGNLYALDASTGAINWTGPTGASIPHWPAVDGGRVFVGSDDSRVYAFPTSCSTPCAPLWATPTAGRISSAPAVSNGVVYIGAGRGAEGDIWALDAVTGTVRWMAPLPSAPRGVAVAGGVVYAAEGSLYAFPTACSTPCSPLWLGQSASAPPAVGGGAVFSDAGFVNNRFNAFPATASCATPCPPLWTGLTNSGTMRAAAVASSRVYLAEGDGTLAAFPIACATPCSPLWTVFIGGFVSDPAVANGVVYTGTDNALQTFDATTGVPIVSIPTGAPTRAPAIANGAVYVSTFDFSAGGRVSVYRIATVVEFARFNVEVELDRGRLASDDSFEVEGAFTLGAGSNGIAPLAETVTLEVGTFSATIPAGSFKRSGRGFEFVGVINGVVLEMKFRQMASNRYRFEAEGDGADLTGTTNPVTVRLTIGDDKGSVSVKAEFD